MDLPSDEPVRYSHPEDGDHDAVLLGDHLKDVARRVRWIIDDDATTPAGESLATVVETLALVHDLGKATTWFQQHIGVLPGEPESARLRHHSPLGSFAAYYLLDEQDFDDETCLAGFVAVAKHHGRLPNVCEYVTSRTNEADGTERLRAIGKQVKDIHDTVPTLASQICAEATDDEDSWTAFAQSCVAPTDSIFDRVSENVQDAVGNPAVDSLPSSFYGLVLECWGALVLADKTSAAGAPQSPSLYDAPTLDEATLEDYIGDLENNADADVEGTRSEKLNHYRSRARRDVLHSLPEFVAGDANVATITLPTGMGKTLTGLHAAIRLRELTDGDRVVYALPFTSIIDQVAEEAADIFDSDRTDGALAVDHHLARTEVDTEDDAVYDDLDQRDDVVGMLGESWRAGLTITTFVQLFESLAGPKNTQSMKIPALRDSVVVLDEPQSLPLSWWKLVPRLVEVLTEQYGATVISMTATQPRLFDDAVSLVDDVSKYFTVAERVRYHLHPSVEDFRVQDGEPLAYDEAADELVADTADGQSTLAICNTIDSARRLTEAVTDRLSVVDAAETYHSVLQRGDDDAVERTVERLLDAQETPFIHLSSRLRPTDRAALVAIVEALREREHSVVAVTTQVVEAGVDLSFESVYRDLAPLDSVVQAAGRCNRSFEQARGDVTVWWLAQPDEQRDTPAVAVYDRTGQPLLPTTIAALESIRDGGRTLDDRVVARRGIVDYYARLDVEKDVGRDQYASLVDTAEARDLGQLSLIDRKRSVDVVVCLTDADRKHVAEFERAHAEYDFARIDDLRPEIKQLTVSVPIYDAGSTEEAAVSNLPPLAGDEDLGIRVADTATPRDGRYFNSTTGFVVPDTRVEDRFL